jgi:zinc and cadmium transporter
MVGYTLVMILLPILLATVIIVLLSLVGSIGLLTQIKRFKLDLMPLVSLSAGTFFGGAFLHLLPEALEVSEASSVLLSVMIAYIAFLSIESLLHWHHCHQDDHHTHSFGYINLLGDGVHNFIDGLVLATAFVTDFKLGVATAIAIAVHEIPQELSDFGVLIHAGFAKKKALMLNFLVAMSVVVGAVVGYLIGDTEKFIAVLIPFAAGGFIYIATSDLIPQIKNKESLRQNVTYISFFIVGILIMYGLTFLEVQ